MDTLKINRALHAAVFNDQQADAFTAAFADCGDYVTKDYLNVTLEAKFAAFEARLLWKMAGLLVLGVLAQKLL